MLRIAPEALHNVLKHLQATRVSVRLGVSPACIALEIVDNGLGFEPTLGRRRRLRFGQHAGSARNAWAAQFRS